MALHEHGYTCSIQVRGRAHLVLI